MSLEVPKKATAALPVKSWADIEQDPEDETNESGGLERYDDDGEYYNHRMT